LSVLGVNLVILFDKRGKTCETVKNHWYTGSAHELEIKVCSNSMIFFPLRFRSQLPIIITVCDDVKRKIYFPLVPKAQNKRTNATSRVRKFTKRRLWRHKRLLPRTNRTSRCHLSPIPARCILARILALLDDIVRRCVSCGHIAIHSLRPVSYSTHRTRQPGRSRGSHSWDVERRENKFWLQTSCVRPAAHMRRKFCAASLGFRFRMSTYANILTLTPILVKHVFQRKLFWNS